MAGRDIAILAGAGSFTDSGISPLRFCGNDVDELGRVLSTPDIAQFEVLKLHDPKRDDIPRALDRISSKLGLEDKLLFYFAGHGTRASNGKLYLVAKDTVLDEIRATGVPIDQVLDMMQESRSSQRIMVLDCCHSGAVGGDSVQFRGQLSDTLRELARSRGTCILAASTGIQFAAERESEFAGKGNGVFTRQLIDGLETGAAAASDAGYVTVDSWYDYAFERVVTQGTQTPMKWVIGAVGNIVIGRSTTGGWRKQREAIKQEFRSLHANHLITGEFLDRVVRVTNQEWTNLSEQEKVLGNLSLRFLRKDITLVELVELLAAKRPDADPSRDRTSKSPAAGNSDKIDKVGLVDRQSAFDKNVITFESLRSLGRNVFLSPAGPIVFMLLCLVVLNLLTGLLNYSARRDVERLMLIFAGGVGLVYTAVLSKGDVSLVRSSRGLSLKILGRIVVHVLSATFAIILLVMGL